MTAPGRRCRSDGRRWGHRSCTATGPVAGGAGRRMDHHVVRQPLSRYADPCKRPVPVSCALRGRGGSRRRRNRWSLTGSVPRGRSGGHEGSFGTCPVPSSSGRAVACRSRREQRRRPHRADGGLRPGAADGRCGGWCGGGGAGLARWAQARTGPIPRSRSTPTRGRVPPGRTSGPREEPRGISGRRPRRPHPRGRHRSPGPASPRRRQRGRCAPAALHRGRPRPARFEPCRRPRRP